MTNLLFIPSALPSSPIMMLRYAKLSGRNKAIPACLGISMYVHMYAFFLFYFFCLFVCLFVCFTSTHIGLFFADRNPSLETSQLNKHPVIQKLNESFASGESNKDTG